MLFLLVFGVLLMPVAAPAIVAILLQESDGPMGRTTKR